MNLPPATLNILQCGVCGVQLSRGPVYLQLDGAALCGSCFTPERKAIRNIHYEALAQFAAFPCKYKYLGCKETVPFIQGRKAIPHEEVCEHQAWVCPMLASVHCSWLGPRVGLLQHCQDQHPDLVLHNPCTLEHDVFTCNEKMYLLHWLQVLFLLHVKASVVAGKLYHSVYYVGRSDEAKDFTFNLYIKHNDEVISKKGEVMPPGYLRIQQTSSMSLDINGLLRILGEFADTTFTVEVLRQARKSVVVCVGCGAQGAVLVHRSEPGWVCERCAPAKRACLNQAWGCNYLDNHIKCLKHEQFFCGQQTQCIVCTKIVKRGSLSVHRVSGCGKVYGINPKWWPARHSKKYLVLGAAGTAVCWYTLNDEELILQVYIPVSSERLREFSCVVRVSQPSTGFMHTYTPDTQYDCWYDWTINVNKTEFPTWDRMFDVLVEVTKIKL